MTNQSEEPAAEVTSPSRWVDEHGDHLFRYALNRVRQTDVAEDLVQETFLAALRGRGQFAGGSSERTWLIGILKHKIIDQLRRQSREQPASDLAVADWTDALFDHTGHWKSGPSEWTNPGAAVEKAEFWRTFSRCIAKLPVKLGVAFSLRNSKTCRARKSARSWTSPNRIFTS